MHLHWLIPHVRLSRSKFIPPARLINPLEIASYVASNNWHF